MSSAISQCFVAGRTRQIDTREQKSKVFTYLEYDFKHTKQ